MKASFRSLHRLLLAAPLLLAACGDTTSDEDLGELQQPLPAGSNAQFVSHTFPLAMHPGERLRVSATMRNTGAASPANNWDSTYSLYRVSTAWSWVSRAVTGTVTPGNNHEFSFVITAPNAVGTHTFSARMRQDVLFGDTASIPNIVTDNATQRHWHCTYLPGSSTLPSSLAPGETRTVTVTVQNTGSQTWPASEAFLRSQDSPAGLWGHTSTTLTTVVAPGATRSFTFGIKAPTTPGTYSFKRQILDSSSTGVGFFDLSNPCVDVSINVGGVNPLNASVTSHNFPTTMTPGEVRVVNVVMNNTGSQPWTGDGSFALFSKNTPASLWGVTLRLLNITTGPGSDATLNLQITAPFAPGSYSHVWQMRKMTGTDAAFFGAIINVPVTVGTLSVDLATQAAGRTLTGSQNNRQLSTVAIGDVTNDGTPDVVVGENATVLSRNQCGRVFGYSGGASFLNGSTTAVTSAPSFEIIGAEALDGFGTLGLGSIVIGDVTGDSVPDLIVGAQGADGVGNLRSAAGEVYLFSGAPGLSGTIDLATAPTQLTATFIGAHMNDALRVLAVGDLTGDGVGDLVLGALDDTNGANAGAVYVIPGGPSLSGTIDLLSPSVTVYTILGAAAGDVLGGRAAIADFGGSSSNDLLIAASNASPGGRSQAGTAYAIFGPIAGDKDMANAVGTANGPNVIWHGEGANDNFGQAVAAGNVTGTSRADVVITATQQRKGGLQFGAANIWAGPLVSGTTYDLSVAGGQTAIIQGADQFDNLGTAVRVADWSGDGTSDIIVTAYAADGPLNDRDRPGELTVIRGGNLSGTINLASHAPMFIAYAGTNVDLMGSRPTTLAVGPINADGKADICVGSQRGATFTGRVDCFAAP